MEKIVCYNVKEMGKTNTYLFVYAYNAEELVEQFNTALKERKPIEFGEGSYRNNLVPSRYDWSQVEGFFWDRQEPMWG